MRKVLVMVFSIFVLTCSPIVVTAQNNSEYSGNKIRELQKENEQLSQRIKRLEPKNPIDIKVTSFTQTPYPTVLNPIPEIIKNGKKIVYQIGCNDPNWERPAYKSYWHSSVGGGRWSYVPNRLHYSLHRLFASYKTGSIMYDFLHDVGIDEEFVKVHDNAAFRENHVFEKTLIVVMQADVKKVLTKGNQLILVAQPKRNGLQLITVKNEDIHPNNIKEGILMQLVTDEGDELDYTVHIYVDRNQVKTE
ncbi:hypothetical protein LSG31_19630 [Fodinisporobacter ferrooxydans]|uniref:Uncharacterized protein n=1 Tax=Fodinisporobacter ferrooxydans TaxID=2901836 RepID=A0ABY4CHV4_9BACL|nr:hypothetical protein LSG31_19630 [Alicyclobacillaceae bacterium MYW30-H2]